MSRGLKRKFMDPPPDLVKWPRLDEQWSDKDLASARLINALCFENFYRIRGPPRARYSRLIEALDLHMYDVSFPENDDVRSQLLPLVQLKSARLGARS